MSDHCAACGQSKPPPAPAIKRFVPRMERVRFERIGQVLSIGPVGAKRGNVLVTFRGRCPVAVVPNGGMRLLVTACETGEGERPGPALIVEASAEIVEVLGEYPGIVVGDWLWIETSWNHSESE